MRLRSPWVGCAICVCALWPAFFRPHSAVAPAPARWILAYAGITKHDYSSYSVDDFVRLLSVVDTAGIPVHWLHNRVLFLQVYATSGRTFYPGFGPQPADGSDWAQYIDSLMGPGAALARLDSAVGVLWSRIGKADSLVSVAVMIPYPDPKADSVRFQGRSYHMADQTDRLKLAASYVHATQQAFVLGRFRRLRLDGFYWLRENCPPADTALVKGVADTVHATRTRFLWIPYYRSAWFDHWRDLGFDEGWLQPNYFFHLDVPQTRLDSTAILAKANNLGVEVEFDRRLESTPAFWDRLGPYLTMLHANSDLRSGSIAVYDGHGALIDLSRGKTARERDLYARYTEALTGDSLGGTR